MHFTKEEIAVLSAQMDEQLRELRDLETQLGASKSASPIDNEEQLNVGQTHAKKPRQWQHKRYQYHISPTQSWLIQK